MSEHIKPDLLSAYLDDQVSSSEKEAVTGHLAACGDCRGQMDDLSAVIQLVKGLPAVLPTEDETRMLHESITAAATTPRRSGWLRPAWAGLGAAAALIVAVVAFGSVARGPGSSATKVGSGTAAGSMSLSFGTDDEVRQAVSGNPRIAAATKKYSSDDVGTMQASLLQSLPEVRSLENAAAADQTAGRFLAPSSSSGAAGAGAPSPRLDAQSAAAPSAFPAGSGKICLGKVLRSQPYPMIPLYAGESSYKTQPAWLLIYAWTPSRSDNAPLNQVQAWMVQPSDCRTLMYQSFKIH